MSDASARPVAAPLFILVLLTWASQLASVAVTSEQAFLSVVGPSTVALIAVTLPLAFIGLRLGPPLGLGAPLLIALLQRRPGAGAQLRSDAILASAIGLVIGAFLWVLRLVLESGLPSELPQLGHRGVLGGLLVSISAAIGEEVWLRLGVMTSLAWLIKRVAGHAELRPAAAWTAILLAALAFGLLHLPQLAAAGAASHAGVAATMLGNMLVATAFGWLYWQRSLIAAIVAHFAVDIVLHVATAMV
jgi:hypothetical protein